MPRHAWPCPTLPAGERPAGGQDERLSTLPPGGRGVRMADVSAEPATVLPPWRRVLAVVAHPDDESFALGAVLAGFTTAGATTAVLCFTHGEASTVHGADGDLYALRATEFAAAAAALGVQVATLLHYPDGQLARTCPARLAGEVIDAARATEADGLLVFAPDGVTGHRDHAAATAAALTAAGVLDLPVIGWTVPASVATALNAEYGTGFTGTPAAAIDGTVAVDRSVQRRAVAAHASQAVSGSVLWRRLALLGDGESLLVLRPGRIGSKPAQRR